MMAVISGFCSGLLRYARRLLQTDVAVGKTPGLVVRAV
jgi:hypothetical protein